MSNFYFTRLEDAELILSKLNDGLTITQTERIDSNGVEYTYDIDIPWQYCRVIPESAKGTFGKGRMIKDFVIADCIRIRDEFTVPNKSRSWIVEVW